MDICTLDIDMRLSNGNKRNGSGDCGGGGRRLQPRAGQTLVLLLLLPDRGRGLLRLELHPLLGQGGLGVLLGVLEDDALVGVYPHLLQGEAHPLLHLLPLVRLLPQHRAGHQGRGRHHVVLLTQGYISQGNLFTPD